jgi:undecaprenyl-diphosphatase
VVRQLETAGYNPTVDIVLMIKAAVMGLVEGLTEFLPISSTGHLILAGQLLGFDNEKGAVFDIVIQTGAILAVVWEYHARFLRVLRGAFSDPAAQRFLTNLAIAFLPAAVVGLAVGKLVKQYLFRPVPVAIAFILGGIVILWAERREHTIRIQEVDDLSWIDALKLGCAQTLAILFPGVSRSGATIIGGLLFGLSRKAATEFSFFLAVPTLIIAGAYQLYKERALLSADDVSWFSVGLITAFLAAFACVRWFLRYVISHDFSLFAWYRIAFGVVVIATSYWGITWTQAAR